MQDSPLRTHRAGLLATASWDATRSLGPPERVLGRRRTEQYWLQTMARGGSPLTPAQAGTFLDDFQLARAGWDKAAVAGLVTDLAARTSFSPVEDVPALASAMAASTALGHAQTSAASKAATFARPEAQVFIWDRLASASARERDRLRLGAGKAERGLYRRREGGHDYASFHAACAAALDEERGKDDFAECLGRLMSHVRSSPGMLATPSAVPDAFIERRLLDKLMFWEGRVLEGSPLPTPRG